MGQQQHRWRSLHALGGLLGLLVRAVPPSRRMDAARLLSRLLEPLIRRTTMCRQQLAMGIDTSREITLFLVLSAMTRAGTRFDLQLKHESASLLDSALASPGGTLVTSPHGVLAYAVVRHLHDRGCDPVVVAQSSDLILGTGVRPRGVGPSPMLLRKVHRHIGNGDVVCAMADRSQANKRTVDLKTPAGRLIVSDALFRMTLQSGGKIVFCSVRVDRRFNIVISWAASGGETRSVASVMQNFGAFVRVGMPSSFGATA